MRRAQASVAAAVAAAQSIFSVKAETFDEMVKLITTRPGTLFVTGVGKSGVVAQKFAGTMASIGFQVSFIDPLEFVHGGAGRIAIVDSVLLISKSGNTAELYSVLKLCKKMGVGIYGLSMAAVGVATMFDMYCASHTRLGTTPEGDKFNLVPTASVIAFLTFLDAVAMECMDMVMDKPEQFKAIHTGGTIGKE